MQPITLNFKFDFKNKKHLIYTLSTVIGIMISIIYYSTRLINTYAQVNTNRIIADSLGYRIERVERDISKLKGLNDNIEQLSQELKETRRKIEEFNSQWIDLWKNYDIKKKQ